MAMPFGHEDLAKLQGFIQFVSATPTILNMPQLKFVKDFIEKFGGKVPEGEFKMPGGGGGKCPFGGDAAGAMPDTKPFEAECDAGVEVDMESDPESEIELDMEGVIEPDIVGDQPMGDPSKTPTEEEVDESSALRCSAAQAYSEQKFEEAIDLYTKAIEINPGNALFHAKRGQAYLKLKKPNACIRDCDEALKLNCDSAAAYKYRGRAYRLLGKFEEAAKDLRQACKLDFDEEADEWLREVTPNAKKIEQHRIKQERKQAERLRKQQEAKRRARADAQAKAQKEASAFAGAGMGGFPFGGGAGAGGGTNFTELLAGMQDPEVVAALDDIAKNPANIDKYKSNPKISKLIDVVKQMKDFPGGFPGFPAGFGGESDKADATPTPEPAKDTKPHSPKADFHDDGLD